MKNNDSTMVVPHYPQDDLMWWYRQELKKCKNLKEKRRRSLTAPSYMPRIIMISKNLAEVFRNGSISIL